MLLLFDGLGVRARGIHLLGAEHHVIRWLLGLHWVRNQTVSSISPLLILRKITMYTCMYGTRQGVTVPSEQTRAHGALLAHFDQHAPADVGTS